jgi:hypothetical protein
MGNLFSCVKKDDKKHLRDKLIIGNMDMSAVDLVDKTYDMYYDLLKTNNKSTIREREIRTM